MIEWVLGACAVLALFTGIWLFDLRANARALATLNKRRPNPSEQEFMSLLADACEPEVAHFLWSELLMYWKPSCTPHPDDDFINELRIDPEEPNDWLEHFCQLEGLDLQEWSEWPPERPTTVRNLATWLSEGRRRQARP